MIISKTGFVWLGKEKIKNSNCPSIKKVHNPELKLLHSLYFHKQHSTIHTNATDLMYQKAKTEHVAQKDFPAPTLLLLKLQRIPVLSHRAR